MGDVKRSGAWTVPADNSFRTWFGTIKLDLRQAQLSAPETHIHARTQIGRTNLQATSAVPGAPRIVLTGGTFFGDIKVRHRRLRDKLRRRGRLTE